MRSAIQSAREAAGLSMSEVGRAVGRSGEWLDSIERGKLTIAHETEQIILEAIRRLDHFHHTIEEAREKLTRDLRLPALPRNPGHPRPGGNHAL